MATGVRYDRMCRANPLDPDNGRVRVCPIRLECQRYHWTTGVGSVHYPKMPPAPYDFEDETCSQYLPLGKYPE